MSAFELTVQGELGAKIRASVGGWEIESMTRGGGLCAAFIEKDVRPGIGDKINTIDGEDVSSLAPAAALDIIRNVLDGGGEVVLGFNRHYSGIILNPIDTHMPTNHKWNLITGLDQLSRRHRRSRDAVREKLYTTSGPRPSPTVDRSMQNLRDIDAQVEVWMREDMVVIHRVIYGEGEIDELIYNINMTHFR
tara:strand:+ start:409 stop:984 length:576 start_codon:yes stop_codon:yes gene_type:complete